MIFSISKNITFFREGRHNLYLLQNYCSALLEMYLARNLGMAGKWKFSILAIVLKRTATSAMSL